MLMNQTIKSGDGVDTKLCVWGYRVLYIFIRQTMPCILVEFHLFVCNSK